MVCMLTTRQVTFYFEEIFSMGKLIFFFLRSAGLRANLFCLVGDLGEREQLTQPHDFCFPRGGF